MVTCDFEIGLDLHYEPSMVPWLVQKASVRAVQSLTSGESTTVQQSTRGGRIHKQTSTNPLHSQRVCYLPLD